MQIGRSGRIVQDGLLLRKIADWNALTLSAKKEQKESPNGRTMSYKVEVIADNSGKWVSNALRFPTEEKAEAYAKDLASRWTLVRKWRVVPADEPAEEYHDPQLGISEPRRRFMTAAQEKAEDKKTDIPLAENFSAGEKVVVDRAWRRHWTFKEAPAPTKHLWSKLFTEVGVVSGIDTWGNVYVMDRYDQVHGREGFPVPARFVKHAGPETN
jgi:hypothetical protein